MITAKKNDTVFIIIFTVLYLLSYFFLIYIEEQNKFYILSNNLYTKNHISFTSKEDYSELDKLLPMDSYRLFLEYNDTYKLMLKNKGNWKPPMISGNFFTETEKVNKAVVGKEMTEFINEYNGKQYISLLGEDFEVSGIIGESFPTPADYIVLLYRPNYTPLESGMKIVLDSDKKSILNNATKQIRNSETLILLESSQKGLHRTANVPFVYTLIIFEFYILFIISIVVFLRYWYEKINKTIFTLYLLGISKCKIKRQIFAKVACNIIISAFISMIVFFIYNFNYAILINQLITIFVVSFVAMVTLWMNMWRDNAILRRR